MKKSTGEKIFDTANVIVLAVLCVVSLYPILYVAFASFSNGFDLIRHEGLLLYPLNPTFEPYKMVFKNPMILRGYGNTLFILTVGVSLSLLLTSIGAYFLSRKDVYFKKVIMMLIVFTMFFEGGLVPFYLTVRDLNLIDSLWAVIIPFSINTYNLIIMRTSFMAIPDSLEESAKLDGAGHFTILFQIILPLSKAVIAVMILYYGVAIWNGWFWASTFIRERTKYPLQVILREILIINDMESMTQGADAADQMAIGESIKYATIMVATLPILCVYPFLQKYFVKGVMVGALKG